MSRSIRSYLGDVDAEDAPSPSQLDPASIESPILDMDPIPGYDDNTLAVLHAIQKAPAEDHVIAKRLGLSNRTVKRCLNQLIHDRKINRNRLS